jgi:hypothetical protein
MMRLSLMVLMLFDYSQLLLTLVLLSQPPYKTLYQSRGMALVRPFSNSQHLCIVG